MVHSDEQLQGLVCVCESVLVYLCTWGEASHITVCGNGTRSGKGFVHYHKDNLLQA